MTVNSHSISTLPRRSRPLVEAALILRVRDLRGSDGWASSHRLKSADGPTIRCRVEVGGATAAWLHVEHWPAGAAWAASSYTVMLIARPQPFGGHRWLLECPVTGKPCSTLFLPASATRLASRRGHGLAFASQRQRAPARAAARARRLAADLGGDGATRPPGMHAATFARRRAELARLVEAAAASVPSLPAEAV